MVLSNQQKHWCGVFPNNFRSLCQRRHLQNVYNLQVGVFHSMSKVWQQHICRQMKFNCCYHSEILLAATTGRHSAAADVTADTRSASFSMGIPKWRDLFKSRLSWASKITSKSTPFPKGWPGFWSTEKETSKLYFTSPCWRHQVETFSALLALCTGNSPVADEFPAHKGQWRGGLMLSLIWAWINGWVSNREAGDLRHPGAHYDFK